MNLKHLNGLLATLALAVFLSCTGSGYRNTSIATPQLKNGRYTITLQNQILEIDPAVGGRISSLTLDGEEILIGKDINSSNWGSTFWPSPQSAWNWPPSAVLDNLPYAASVENQVLKLVSQTDPKLGYVFTKEISGNSQKLSFAIKYSITNKTMQTQQVAPWEITRVKPNGLTFYPTGPGEKSGTLAPYTENKAAITWFDYQFDKIPTEHLKLFADGAEGWLAQVNQGKILIKQFPDVPAGKAAPAEGEIEVYSARTKNYIEIEQQGTYTELPPGAATTWEVTWYLRKLPNNIKAESGNAALMDFVRELVR